MADFTYITGYFGPYTIYIDGNEIDPALSAACLYDGTECNVDARADHIKTFFTISGVTYSQDELLTDTAGGNTLGDIYVDNYGDGFYNIFLYTLHTTVSGPDVTLTFELTTGTNSLWCEDGDIGGTSPCPALTNLSTTSTVVGIEDGGDYSFDGSALPLATFTYEPPPIYGCTDEESCNYNSEANVDDESCIYPEVGDINEDCAFDVLDVVQTVEVVLQDSLQTEEQLMMSDLNNDGVIDVIDIVILIGIILGRFLMRF